jgi:alpha-L-fucosidase
MKQWMTIMALAAAMVGGMEAQATDAAVLAERGETQKQHDARLAWFREARFGMFIHWGIYAQAAGRWNDKPVRGLGEWIMHQAKVPIADYAKLAEAFNPVKYDADAWVLAARNAGMKYIVITSKHHDGFAMFRSKATPYNIGSTPFKREPLKELAKACRKHGM